MAQREMPGGSWPTVAEVGAVMAAGAFVQAVAQHFGNRVAGALDEGARSAVRRFRRRTFDGRTDRQGRRCRWIKLKTERGWTIFLPERLPAEALGQLADLCDADPPCGESSGLVRFGQGVHAWSMVSRVDGEYVVFDWDPAKQLWITR
ncbi:hypothetical protein VT50_0214575 [Streptomyces antioxidans]|uniref:Uncharacterized protein n=1 Tax=Streptomyces antioxidans TaxID=1507734 RepID=A0A1V4D5M2_9ACTN|nr:hypothetical protein [Streptomyces antioxidans]OPF79951.1 hypothetical protein VT50_0214575 [Streptomyces antioxidans]